MSAAGVNPDVTTILEGLSGDRLILRIHELDDAGDQISSQRQLAQVVVEGIIGSPEGRALGSVGDLRVRRDVAQLWQKITGDRTRTGWQLLGSGGGGGDVTVEENGAVVGTTDTLNFIGLTVTAGVGRINIAADPAEIEILDNGASVADADAINFIGFTVADAGGGQVNVTAPASEIAVEEDGVSVGTTDTLNFSGLSATVVGSTIEVRPIEWVERYLGDIAAAPSVNLAAGVSPTVAIPNVTTTPGQVASANWISNAGNPTATVTQGAVGAFGTDGAGILMTGASASTNMSEVAANAPHIYLNWRDVLGEDVRGGVDYCVMVRFVSQNINTAAQAAGMVIYEPNDGVPEPNISGNPAIDDEKRFAGWIENVAGVLTINSREESPPTQGINGPLIPVGFDTVGFIMGNGGSGIQTIVGVSVGNVLPDPDTMVRVPGPFLGGSTTYPSHPYGTRNERLALAFQQQLGSTFNARADWIRVLSRGGRAAP